jgi:ABC-type multidrug transport system fused ATPase/permease subunit
VAQESLANVMLVQAYNRQDQEMDRFYQQNLGNFATKMTAVRLRGLFSPLVDLLQLLGVLVVVGVGTWELSQGRLSLGGLLVFLAYLQQLYSPVRGMSSLVNSLYSASASAERIIEFMDQRPSVVEHPDAVSLQKATGFVTLERVSFAYPGGEEPALASVSFSVGPGETLALVGPSGAGKSTIAKLLLRFYDPTDGRILLDGRDLRDLSVHSLRENATVLLQETLVFHGSIRDNIAYGRTGATEEEIVRAADAAGAHEFIVSMADGYETIIGERGQRLSGGQRQRIAIARAMLRDTPLLILDEPTTGLDASSGWRIIETLQRLMNGRTTIIISHNLITTRDADSIVVLENGRVVEQGAHGYLIEQGGVYSRLYRLHNPDAVISISSRAA